MSVPQTGYATYLSARLQRLSEALVELRSRVRVAVAEELGKIVAETVRDVVTVAVGKVPSGRAPSYGRSAPRYADDGWDDPYAWEEYEFQPDHGPAQGLTASYPPATPPAATAGGVHPAALRSAALAIGVGVARWCIQRRGNTFGSLTLGLAAGLVALTGGPLTRAGLAALATTRELLGIANSLDDVEDKALER